MATIVYLDVDDEITSAAARLRASSESRIALVLPHGSRLSTSRMNFRLLAREAASHGRRLAIVAPDAGTRALAASAGLPVHASVSEYEAAEEGAAGMPPDAPTGTTAAPSAASAAATTSSAMRQPAPSGGDEHGTARGLRDPGRRTRGSDDSPTLVMPPPEPSLDRSTRSLPVARPRRPLRIGGVAIAGVFVLLLAAIVAGVAAWLYLPTTTITIRPRLESVQLPPFTVTADPTATAVDAEAAIIPAITVEIPVTAQVEQAATGERVEETRATGSVRFESINTVGPVAVPEGTRVSTLGGIVFVTTEAITVPAATVAGSQIERGVATTGVRARLAGPEGNVDPGDITQVPDFLRTQQVSVLNPAATSGGTREVFRQVQQADIDAALEAVRTQLEAEFAAALANPPGIPAGATTFPEAASLGAPAITPDPATLLEQEIDSFTLEASATGQVLAVDEAPLQGIAEDRIASQVSPGHELVPGSIRPDVGPGQVLGGVVTFTLAGSASETATLDAAQIEAEIRGRPIVDVEEELAALGEVDVEAWPDFVTTVPTLDERVTVLVEPAGAVASPEPVPSSSMSRPAVPVARAALRRITA